MGEPPPPNREVFLGDKANPGHLRTRGPKSLRSLSIHQLRHDMECIPADVSVGQLPYKASGHFQF